MLSTQPMIDVTMVCTLRPDIIRRTLESLCNYVKYSGKMQAVVNVDNAPENTDWRVESVKFVIGSLIALASMRYVVVSPSFTRAVMHVWADSTAKYVLHMEDDWEFVRDIDLDAAVDMMERGDADYIRFGKRNQVLAEEGSKVALLPSLWRGETVRNLSRVMHANVDPEKQLRFDIGYPEIEQYLPTKIAEWPGGQCVRDIGREWRDERGLVKWDKNKQGDVTWTKSESQS